jgi:MATE family multidrug resistance protein
MQSKKNGIKPETVAVPTTGEAISSLIKLAAPLCASQVAQSLIGSVCVMFAGRFGVAPLGGVGMGISIMNATGYAFGSGFCGALETLLSHSYGRNPSSKKYGTHAQRMVLLLLMLSIPLGALLCFIDVVLLALGIHGDVVFFTTVFIRMTVFGLVPMMLVEVQRRYLACQHLSKPVSGSVVTAALALPLLIMIFLNHPFDLGFLAIPSGWVCVMILMNLGLLGYLYFTGKYKETWGGWSRSALRHWGPMLHLGLPSLGMTFAEWSTMEVLTVLGGFNPPDEYAAYAISVQVVIIIWNIPAGIYSGIAVLIGNSIGAGQNMAARKHAIVSIGVVFCITLTNVTTLWILGRRVAMLFTMDEVVLRHYEHLLPFFTLWHMTDTFQSNMLGILRGAGMQDRGAWMIFTVMMVCGVPLSVLMGFKLGMGPAGLWCGIFLSVLCIGVPLYTWSFAGTDWQSLRAHGEDPVVLEEDCVESPVIANSPAFPS